MDTYYAKGTIKIMNANGELVAFHPKTRTQYVSSASSVGTVEDDFDRIAEKIEIASTAGAVKLMEEMPTDENTAEYPNGTFIGYLFPEE